MKSTFGRRLYDLIFLAVVAAGIFAFRGFYKTAEVYLSETLRLGPFGTIVLIILIITGLIGLNYLREAIASTFISVADAVGESAPVKFEGGQYQSSLIRSARKLEKRKDFAQAGEVWESLEAYEQAATAYEKANLLTRAAAAWERVGDMNRAIELYEADKNYEAAANRCTTEGLRERAKRNLIFCAEHAYEENTFAKAAELFERAQEYERAGKIYEQLKRQDDALRCYERGGSADKVEQLLKGLKPSSATGTAASQETLRRAAELLVREGKALEAAEALENSGDLTRAAEVYLKAGAYDRAGEAYFKAEMIPQAEAAFERVQNQDQVADFQARVAMQKGDWDTAGKKYFEAGKPNQAIDAYKRARDFVAAARVYESIKRYLMAAEMYSSARDFKSAADAYAKGHDWRNAAECFEQMGDLGQAVEAWIAAGNFYRAGFLAFKSQDYQKAIECFQRVSNTSPEWKASTGYLGASFFFTGKEMMARELLERVAEELVPSADNLAVFYAYGRIMESINISSALAAYRKVLSVSVDYEDVSERIQQVEHGTFHEQPTFRGTQGYQSQAAVLSESGFSHEATVRTQTPTFNMTRRQSTQSPETRFGDDGRYSIVHELGRGSFAIVYKAFDQHLEREVALKTFPLSRNAGPGREDVFLNQTRQIARLVHPNIVTIFDCGHMNFLYYIAMEFVPGENLKQLVKRRGPMSLEEMRTAMKQTCDALTYAHDQNVLHRDIKPSNMIHKTTGDVKIVDFGINQIVTDAATSANFSGENSTVAINPQYMAPEQITGNPVSIRTDIYGLGLSMFYLLTGHTPFDMKKITDPTEISRMQVQGALPVPSMLRATLSPKVDSVFVKCTQKNPADRYDSVAEFWADFEKVILQP
jgi:tetratricopeptide (TPR) repeat protein